MQIKCKHRSLDLLPEMQLNRKREFWIKRSDWVRLAKAFLCKMRTGFCPLTLSFFIASWTERNISISSDHFHACKMWTWPLTKGMSSSPCVNKRKRSFFGCDGGCSGSLWACLSVCVAFKLDCCSQQRWCYLMFPSVFAPVSLICVPTLWLANFNLISGKLWLTNEFWVFCT